MRGKPPGDENEKKFCEDFFIARLLFKWEKYKSIILTNSHRSDLFLDRMYAADSSFYY